MEFKFLTALFGTNSRPDITATVTKQEAAIPAKKNSPSESLSTVQTSRFGSDVEALLKKHGNFTNGLSIEETLQELLKICPRKRARIDAYQGLVSYLNSEYGVRLIIKSRKTKNGDLV